MNALSSLKESQYKLSTTLVQNKRNTLCVPGMEEDNFYAEIW